MGNYVAADMWKEFHRSLRARGLSGVQLVISDTHAGLVAVIAQVFLGTAWQRCRVHFVRGVLARIEAGSGAMVAATIRTIFAQARRHHRPQPAAPGRRRVHRAVSGCEGHADRRRD
jgi:putative transposase